MALLNHYTKAQTYFDIFKTNGYLAPADHSDFLYNCTEALKHIKGPYIRKDMLDMMEEVVHALGIPGAMYGHAPGYRGNELFRLEPSLGADCRDHNGRWCTSRDMIGVVIDWDDDEDLAWEREQEYVEAYRESRKPEYANC